MNTELITTPATAKRDGRNLAAAARTRLTPADDALVAVYSGLYLHYLPFGVDDFKSEFHKNVGGEV